MAEIEDVLPAEPETVTLSTGRQVEVRKIVAGQLPKILNLLKKCNIAIREDGFDIFSVYESFEFFEILELLSEDVSGHTFEDIVTITGKVFDVNKDFFAPAVARLANRGLNLSSP